MQELVWHEGVKGNFTPGNSNIDVEDRYDVLVDANDQILERVVSDLVYISRYDYAGNLYFLMDLRDII